jgi:hypothetical protein
MSDKPLPRPPQVTLCAAAIIVGSVFVLLIAFDEMAGLGSIEAQERAADFVGSPPGDGLGLSADEVQSLLRVLCVIAGGAAVAAAMLGYRVFKRERSARIALSVIAPVLVLTGVPIGDFIPAVVGVAVLMLWFQPARDWFDGKPMQQRPTLAQARAAAVSGTQPHQHAQPSHPAQPPAPDAAQPGAPWTPPASPGVAPYAGAERPRSVLTAAYVTIGCSATVALVLLSALFTALTDRAQLEADVADQISGNDMYADLDPGPIVVLLYVMIGLFVVWALVAILLAVLTLRGSDGARVALVVSAFGGAAASLLGILVVVPLAVGALCVWVAVLLLRGDVTRWYADQRRPRS